MFSLFRTRAKARALIGAALAGVLIGAAVGGAYLAGAQAQATEEHARIGPFAAAAQAGYAAAAHSPLPAPIRLADNGEPPARVARISAPPKPKPASPFHLAGLVDASRDIDCLSAAVYYEARGEGAEGQAAVAQVVLNRARQPSFPKSVCGVVYQGCQFSFACNGATRGAREPGAWLRARTVAARALGGYVMAQVGRATSFHAARLGASGGAVKVGGHVFFGALDRSGDAGRVFVAETPSPEPKAAGLAPQPAAAAAPPPEPIHSGVS